MKRLFGLVLALVGVVLIGYAGYHLLGSNNIYHYGIHPMYPGLGGVVCLTAGLLMRQE